MEQAGGRGRPGGARFQPDENLPADAEIGACRILPDQAKADRVAVIRRQCREISDLQRHRTDEDRRLVGFESGGGSRPFDGCDHGKSFRGGHAGRAPKMALLPDLVAHPAGKAAIAGLQ